MKSQLEAIAGADSIEKLTSNLAGLMATTGGEGSDARLMNTMHSVPGSRNSQQGFEAMADMIRQQAGQQQKLMDYVNGRYGPYQGRPVTSGEDYANRKREFYENPGNWIRNPITGNPIQNDLKAQQQGGAGASGEPVSVSSPADARKLPSGTPIRMPDGSVGRVP
jgi:hypothetical protein